MDNLAYIITPDNSHKLSIITGIDKKTLDTNLTWIVFRHISNRYRWAILPVRLFRERYPQLEPTEL